MFKKKCSFCDTYLKMDLAVPLHKCNANHDGSSGSMESTLCRQMLEEVTESTNSRVSVGTLVTDDDSTLRSHCKLHENGGKLRAGVPEPTFLADPSHRVKVMLKPIFALVSSTKNPDEVKHVDALRLRKYTSCYITRHRTDDFTSFFRNARAPVEHLFSNHEFCDASWCWTKEIDERLHNVIKNAMKKR